MEYVQQVQDSMDPNLKLINPNLRSWSSSSQEDQDYLNLDSHSSNRIKLNLINPSPLHHHHHLQDCDPFRNLKRSHDSIFKDSIINSFDDSQTDDPLLKKIKSQDPSHRILPERHARKQNFACDLCRKLKIKCVFIPGQENWVRCVGGVVECLDGSSMRAAAAAARAQQGSKKRRRRGQDIEETNPDPEPILMNTKVIQTRAFADTFQEVIDEPKSEIQVGSLVQVKKSTQHHYKAKESVVTRMVCKVVAVYLDGSESNPIPINLVRLSEKQKKSNPTALMESSSSQSLSDAFPITSAGAEWNPFHPSTYSISAGPLPHPLIPQQLASPIMMKTDERVPGTDHMPPTFNSHPDSGLAQIPDGGQVSEMGSSLFSETVFPAHEPRLARSRASDSISGSGLPILSIDTALASTYPRLGIESQMETPSTGMGGGTIACSPMSRSSTTQASSSYGLDLSLGSNLSHGYPTCFSPPPFFNQNQIGDLHHPLLSQTYSMNGSIEGIRSPTETSPSSSSITSPNLESPSQDHHPLDSNYPMIKKLQTLIMESMMMRKEEKGSGLLKPTHLDIKLESREDRLMNSLLENELRKVRFEDRVQPFLSSFSRRRRSVNETLDSVWSEALMMDSSLDPHHLQQPPQHHLKTYDYELENDTRHWTQKSL